jgi:hypothetical protein
MRQVEFKRSTKFVDYATITDSSIIGILWGDKSKSLVILGYDNVYRGVGNSSLCSSRAWGTNSKQLYAIKANEQISVTVLEFESQKELLTWFAE